MIMKEYNSCTIYILLSVIAFLIIMGVSSACFYFHWYLKNIVRDNHLKVLILLFTTLYISQ